MRFSSLLELLTWLSVDLAAGRAQSLWYWRSWVHLFDRSPGQALHDLFQEWIAYLPSVSARLAKIGELGRVWAALTPGQAISLQAGLSHYTGWGLPRPATPTATGTEPVSPPGLLRQRWSGVLRSLPPQDPRCWLAACLVAMEWRPLLLRGEASGRLFHLSRALALPAGSSPLDPPGSSLPETSAALHPGRAAGSSAPSDSAEASRAVPTAASTPAPRRGATEPFGSEYRTGVDGGMECSGQSEPRRWFRPTAAIETPSLPARASLQAGKPTARGRPTKPRPSGQSGVGLRVREVGDPPSVEGQTGHPTPRAGPAGQEPYPVRHESEAVFPQDRPEPTADLDLYTEEGGLFYLINFLQRPEVDVAIEAAGGRWRLPDGWAWLYRLGSQLGLQPDGPLAGFLAAQMGLRDPMQLAALAPLPGAAALLGLGEELYAEQGLWSPRLLSVPAWIQGTQSDLDLHLPLSAVRLAVRLAGLDMDPGWVPWLGRVVHFHYRDFDRSGEAP